RHCGRPVLEIWDHSSRAIDMVLGIDHRAAGEMMARTMLDRGYRKPAWVGPDEGFDSRAEERLEGFARTFAKAGYPLVHTGRVGRPHSFEGGLSGTRACLADAAPDLIFYLNDHMALGGLMECERQGLSVPDDIGLAGFNDLSVNDVLNRRLTTIRTPRRDMGEAGARMLVASILNVPQRKVEPMGVTFVEGDTTRHS
ncbi:MAG: substrate-binding domain-containing protein, partial [Pseudomonadota bacterium]